MAYFRDATAEELRAHVDYYIKYHRRVSFRHFTTETIRRNAKHGVAHRKHSRSFIREQDGKLFVNWQGKLQEITASAVKIDGDDKWHVHDVRIKSEYLK